MSELLNMYPVLNDSKIADMNYECQSLEFGYTDNYEEYPLSLEDRSGLSQNFTAKLFDPRCAWSSDTCNLIIKKRSSFGDVSMLFGQDGIAPKNASLGIALSWISTGSEHRGIIPFGEIKADDDLLTYELDYTFKNGLIKGSIILQTVIYLMKAGNRSKNEIHLANQTGTVLGILDQCEIYIDGSGSIFPISTVNEPGKPLWYVYYESMDPLQDKFEEENVEIRINIAHHNYEQLKIDTSLKESPLFLEIISSALMIIIYATKDCLDTEWENVISGQGFERGSIAEAIYYFVNKHQWDVSNPVALSKSIHLFFDKNLPEGSL